MWKIQKFKMLDDLYSMLLRLIKFKLKNLQNQFSLIYLEIQIDIIIIIKVMTNKILHFLCFILQLI